MRYKRISWRMIYSHLVQEVLIPLKDYSSNSSHFILFLKQCGIEKKEYQLILSMLSKLCHEYSVFVSTFHATGIAILNWKMPSLSTLFDSLKKDQDKLIHMGYVISSKGKDHALMVQVSTLEEISTQNGPPKKN